MRYTYAMRWWAMLLLLLVAISQVAHAQVSIEIGSLAAHPGDEVLRIGSPPAATITVGSATAAPGGSATVEVVLDSRVPVVATQNDLLFAPPLRVRSCTINPAIHKNSVQPVLRPSGCIPGIDCAGARVLVFSLTNPSPIPTGSVLYTCTIDVAGDTPLMTVLPIGCEEEGASGSDAKALDTVCRAGAVTTLEPVVSLDVGHVDAAPGQRAIVPVQAHLLQEGAEVTTVQIDLRVDAAMPFVVTDAGEPDCSTALSVTAFSQFRFQPAGCDPGFDCTSARARVSREATAPLPDGAVVFACTLQVAPATAAGVYAIRHVPGLQRATAADGSGIGVRATDGEVDVRLACRGDCNGDRHVPVNELVTGVNVFLERIPLATCTAFDRNGDGSVTVDELVAAVNDALHGCAP